MFENCNKLTVLDMQSFKAPSSLSSTKNMFKSCSELVTLNLANLDTSSVTNMEQMFYYYLPSFITP